MASGWRSQAPGWLGVPLGSAHALWAGYHCHGLAQGGRAGPCAPSSHICMPSSHPEERPVRLTPESREGRPGDRAPELTLPGICRKPGPSSRWPRALPGAGLGEWPPTGRGSGYCSLPSTLQVSAPSRIARVWKGPAATWTGHQPDGSPPAPMSAALLGAWQQWALQGPGEAWAAGQERGPGGPPCFSVSRAGPSGDSDV